MPVHCSTILFPTELLLLLQVHLEPGRSRMARRSHPLEVCQPSQPLGSLLQCLPSVPSLLGRQRSPLGSQPCQRLAWRLLNSSRHSWGLAMEVCINPGPLHTVLHCCLM